MIKLSKINMLASAVIVAGGLYLSAPAPAQAAAFDGCDDAVALLQRAADSCADRGGEFTYSGWCEVGGPQYSVNSSCAYWL